MIVPVKVNFVVAADSKNLWKDSWSYKHVRFGSYVDFLFFYWSKRRSNCEIVGWKW